MEVYEAVFMLSVLPGVTACFPPSITDTSQVEGDSSPRLAFNRAWERLRTSYLSWNTFILWSECTWTWTYQGSNKTWRWPEISQTRTHSWSKLDCHADFLGTTGRREVQLAHKQEMARATTQWDFPSAPSPTRCASLLPRSPLSLIPPNVWFSSCSHRWPPPLHISTPL